MVYLDSSPLPQFGFRKGEPVGARFSEPPKNEFEGFRIIFVAGGSSTCIPVNVSP
jgi:hypothetical protein